MDIPIGVLYDTITSSLNVSEEERLPFKITATYKRKPELKENEIPPPEDSFLPTKVWTFSYVSNFKECVLYRTGNAKIDADKLK